MASPEVGKERQINYKKYLRELTSQVDKFLDILNEEMKKPSDFERGKRIARLCNFLNMNNDSAKHYGLGVPLNKC